MKTAILGGTFDPIHLGHLALAREVIHIGYQRILFVPARRSPHKERETSTSAEDRLEMLRLVLETMPWAVLWGGEFNRPTPSYTIDTIDELHRVGMIPNRPGLIIGDDLAGSFSSWKEAKRLAESTNIILAHRIGGSVNEFPYPHQRLCNPIWPYSSTRAREIIAKGSSLDSILPGPIIPYIRKKGLYGSP